MSKTINICYTHKKLMHLQWQDESIQDGRPTQKFIIYYIGRFHIIIDILCNTEYLIQWICRKYWQLVYFTWKATNDRTTVDAYSSLSFSLLERLRSDDLLLSRERDRLSRDLRRWLRDRERLLDELAERRLPGRDLSTDNTATQLFTEYQRSTEVNTYLSYNSREWSKVSS